VSPRASTPECWPRNKSFPPAWFCPAAAAVFVAPISSEAHSRFNSAVNTSSRSEFGNDDSRSSPRRRDRRHTRALCQGSETRRAAVADLTAIAASRTRSAVIVAGVRGVAFEFEPPPDEVAGWMCDGLRAGGGGEGGGDRGAARASAIELVGKALVAASRTRSAVIVAGVRGVAFEFEPPPDEVAVRRAR
jgi:hypothetical protein